jgi:hypothetical protein
VGGRSAVVREFHVCRGGTVLQFPPRDPIC